jgi:two-component system cell cycle response regulator DivK
MATILIVEDNPTNMKLSTFVLESADYTVITATDAEIGLTLARESCPDLILMDIQLPGMDGLEATALLKADVQRAIPVVALTALAMKGDEERVRAAGCDGHREAASTTRSCLATVKASLEKATAAARIKTLEGAPQQRRTIAPWRFRRAIVPSSNNRPTTSPRAAPAPRR